MALGSKVWHDFYWETNSMNYRDKEPEVDGERDFFFVGDSYSAGAGIVDVENRFSNIFEKTINQNKEDIKTYNLAYEGIDTKGEFDYCLSKYEERTGISPEFIILQYFGNDIEIVALENNLERSSMDVYEGMIWPFNSFLRNSYLFNYFYFFKCNPVDGIISNYFEFFIRAYEDKLILNEHLEHLGAFIDFSNEKKAPLIVIILPFFHNLPLSNEMYGEEIEGYFKDRNIKTINLCEDEYLLSLTIDELVVSNFDYHCSMAVHEHISKLLSELVTKNFNEQFPESTGQLSE
jgi:hypothetical protein